MISLMASNSSFYRVEQFKYLVITLTNLISTPEEIKSRLQSGNACCHSVQKLFSSSLLSKNIKITVTEVQVLLFLYGCETWSNIKKKKDHPAPTVCAISKMLYL